MSIKDRNVWVFNRGHWPVIKLDRTGKMLEAWTDETLRVRSSHGLRVGPDGNIWCVDVDGHVVIKLSPQGRVLMVLGNRQGSSREHRCTGCIQPADQRQLPGERKCAGLGRVCQLAGGGVQSGG